MNSRMRIVATLGLLLAVACDDGGGSSDAVDSGYPLEDGGPGPGPGPGPDDDSGPGNDLDGGPGPGNGDSGPGNDIDGGDTTDAGPSAPQSLPFYVDDYYVASGYMGDNQGSIVHTNCAEAGPSGDLRLCHQFEQQGNCGIYWQYPANNWSPDEAPMAGLPIPPGATGVQFWAWGAAGGEQVNFGTGMAHTAGGQPDHFKVELEFTLTTTPTKYWLDLSGVSYDTVVGGFLWYGQAPGTFFVDGIEWTNEAAPPPPDGGVDDAGTDPVDDAGAGDGGTGPVGPETLPVLVDDFYRPSGYFGTGVARSDCAQAGPSNDLAYCHKFAVNPGGDWGGGVFWQYPENNWTAPGLTMPQGATRIRFWAWSETAGVTANFGAGIGGDPPHTSPPDRFHVERQGVVLTTTPTLYEVDLSGISYTRVAGGFLFAVIGTGTIFLDGIQWAGPDDGDAGVDGGIGGGDDAGIDGGSEPVDAGSDAGPELDAGVDAGPEADAGSDQDAGTAVDAGPAMDAG